MTIQHPIFDNDYFVINRLVDGEYKSFKVSGSQMHDYFDYNPIPPEPDIQKPVIMSPTDGFGVNGHPTTSTIVEWFGSFGVVKFNTNENLNNGSFNVGDFVVDNLGIASGTVKEVFPTTNRIELEKPYDSRWRPEKYSYMINNTVTGVGIDLNATFVSSEFSPKDSNNAHLRSYWQITSPSDPEFIAPSVDVTVTDSSRTNFAPVGGLTADTEYLVRVMYATEIEEFGQIKEITSEWSEPIHVKTST